MQSTPSFSTRSYALVSQLGNCFKQTPLLAGYLLVGLLVTGFLKGWAGVGQAMINLLLLALYILLIRWLTPHVPAPVPIKHPRLELAAALALLGLVLVVQLFDFSAWNIQPWQQWVRSFFLQVQQGISAWELPGWVRQSVYLAVSSTLKQLLPTLLVFALLRYGPSAMGLARPHGKLTATLVGITAVLGLAVGVLLRVPLGQVLGLYLVGVFINALPEELFFRGMLLPRLERVLANPLNALVISALLFNALHVPIEISQGVSPLMALLGIFAVHSPTGLVWGYLYQRTRSIIPGTLWHAANGRLGFLFMDLS